MKHTWLYPFKFQLVIIMTHSIIKCFQILQRDDRMIQYFFKNKFQRITFLLQKQNIKQPYYHYYDVYGENSMDPNQFSITEICFLISWSILFPFNTHSTLVEIMTCTLSCSLPTAKMKKIKIIQLPKLHYRVEIVWEEARNPHNTWNHSLYPSKGVHYFIWSSLLHTSHIFQKLNHSNSPL